MYGGYAAGPVSVRHDADAQADCRHRKDLQINAFRKRLKGFEPSTFCMASRTWCPGRPGKVLQNHGLRLDPVGDAFPAFAAKSREFPD